MELNDECRDAIKEIGNLCIAGGSNKISEYSDDIVDISVVEAEIKDFIEVQIELDATDTCKALVRQAIVGDIFGQFLFKISNEMINVTLSKFPKLKSFAAGGSQQECLIELVDGFCKGFAEGMQGMTGLRILVDGDPTVLEEVDQVNFPQKVLRYNSIITVGDERIDFDVFFFSDAEQLIPKVLESIGMQ